MDILKSIERLVISGIPNKSPANCLINIQTDNVDYSWKLLAEKYVSKYIPKYIQEEFNKQNWRFYVVGYSLGKRFYMNQGYKCNGITDKNTKGIYIENRKTAMPAIPHEFGHYVDFYNNKSSQTAMFKQLYHKYANKFYLYYDLPKREQRVALQEMYADCVGLYLCGKLSHFGELNAYIELELKKIESKK